jgi:DNA-binding MarR family transcriptional regulator
MTEKSTNPYRFGDLLALARQSWIRHMADELQALGYSDYRRSDAAAVRQLQRSPRSIGRLGAALGVTRQAARKVADGLERRGFVTLARDREDGRQIKVSLTRRGEDYAKAVTSVIERLNRDLADRVDLSELVAADTVLRAVLTDDHTQRLARYLSDPLAASSD